MTQLKDIPAFEDLQGIVGYEIAGIFLARLKEFNVPEDRLAMLADEICYDIASAMHALGDYEIAGVAPTTEVDKGIAGDMAFSEEKTDEVDLPKSGACELAFLEDKTDEIEPPVTDLSGPDFLEEKTDEIVRPGSDSCDLSFLEQATGEYDLMNAGDEEHSRFRVKGVMSQEEIVRILNSAKSVAA